MAGDVVLGSTNIDLADYAKPDKYMQNLTLQNLKNIGEGSFIVVEIRTFDAAKPENSVPTTSVRASGSGPKNVLQAQADKLTADNEKIEQENERIR